MSFSRFKYLVLSDLYRITGKITLPSFLWHFFFGESYKYAFWLRTCSFAYSNSLLKYLFYPFAKLILNHFKFKLGISIPPSTKINSGLYIGHFGGIVINGNCEIGKNFNISQGVTLGVTNRGKNKGCPKVGDNVYIGPGAKIIGAVTIGNNVAIGANCVVTKSIPDNSVAVGIPARIISQEGSTGYVNRIDYDGILHK